MDRWERADAHRLESRAPPCAAARLRFADSGVGAYSQLCICRSRSRAPVRGLSLFGCPPCQGSTHTTLNFTSHTHHTRAHAGLQDARGLEARGDPRIPRLLGAAHCGAGGAAGVCCRPRRGVGYAALRSVGPCPWGRPITFDPIPLAHAHAHTWPLR